MHRTTAVVVLPTSPGVGFLLRRFGAVVLGRRLRLNSVDLGRLIRPLLSAIKRLNEKPLEVTEYCIHERRK